MKWYDRLLFKPRFSWAWAIILLAVSWDPPIWLFLVLLVMQAVVLVGIDRAYKVEEKNP